MSWFAVGAAVASMVVSQYNANKTAKKQDKAAAASFETQSKIQREANVRQMAQLDDLAKSDPTDEKSQRSSDIRAQLRKNQAMALAGMNPTGGGQAVQDAIAGAGSEATGYGDFINESLSGIDAPIMQRQGEAFQAGDVESQLNRLRRNSSQEDNLLRLRQAGIRPSPLLNMISTGLSAYAGAKGFGGSPSTLAGTPNVPTSATNPVPQWYTNPLGTPAVNPPQSGWKGIPYKI